MGRGTGRLVGSREGLSVGLDVGRLVGSSVGLGLGRLVGLAVVGLLARGALIAMNTAVTTARPRHAIDAVGWATLLRSERSVNLPQARFFNSQDPSRFCDICRQNGLPEPSPRLCSRFIFLGSPPEE